jgi:hypothetical protein
MESLILPLRFPAANPPSTLLAPPVTSPLALESRDLTVISADEPTGGAAIADRDCAAAPLASIDPPLFPTNPPALLLPVTLPNAKLPEIEPLLFPANPPASPPLLVAVTLPAAEEPVMVPALSPTKPPVLFPAAAYVADRKGTGDCGSGSVESHQAAGDVVE